MQAASPAPRRLPDAGRLDRPHAWPPFLGSRIYVVANWVGIGILAASVPVLCAIGSWIGAATMLPFLAAALGLAIFDRKLPALFNALLSWAAVINAAGYAWNLYDMMTAYDDFVHLTTIVAITLTSGFLAYHSLAISFRAHGVLFVVTITSFGIAVAALWEMFEWTFGFIGPIPDTMIDIGLGSAGALAAALLSRAALPSTEPEVAGGASLPRPLHDVERLP